MVIGRYPCCKKIAGVLSGAISFAGLARRRKELLACRFVPHGGLQFRGALFGQAIRDGLLGEHAFYLRESPKADLFGSLNKPVWII